LKSYQTGEMKQRLFQMVQIEDLVPENHFLRQINAVLELSFIRELVQDSYDQSTNLGRRPWDPVILVQDDCFFPTAG